MEMNEIIVIAAMVATSLNAAFVFWAILIRKPYCPYCREKNYKADNVIYLKDCMK